MLGEHLTDDTTSDLSNTSDDDSKSRNERRGWISRVRINIPLEIQAGSSSQRTGPAFKAQCRDASETGCGIISEIAPRVGDIYQLRFGDGNVLQEDSVFARCVRCHLIRDEKFEAGFLFLAKQQLRNSTQLAASNESLF